jgi:hypothetical protein
MESGDYGGEVIIESSASLIASEEKLDVMPVLVKLH